jgi:hypothetical protein
MRTLFLALSFFLSGSVSAQEKKEYTSYNKLIEVQGTDFAIATFEDHSKKGISGRHILFINTLTGTSRQVDLGNDQYLYNIEQIKLDSLGINRIIAIVGMYHPKEMKGLVLSSWRKVVVFSPDGEQMLDGDGNVHFASSWLTNQRTGSLVVAGYTDSDGNGKHDVTDKNAILIYDLKNMKVINKI